MKQQTNDLISQNRIFIRIAFVTAALLLIPLIAMQFTTEVRWDETDFIVMGCLLFGASVHRIGIAMCDTGIGRTW